MVYSENSDSLAEALSGDVPDRGELLKFQALALALSTTKPLWSPWSRGRAGTANVGFLFVRHSLALRLGHRIHGPSRTAEEGLSDVSERPPQRPCAPFTKALR